MKIAGWNTASSTDLAKTRRHQAGFTLVELLVVLVILGLLAGLAGPRIIGYVGGSRQDSAALQISYFKTALDLYRLDVADYPTSQQGLTALITQPDGVDRWNGPYLKELPKDPWGNDYVYKSPGDDGEYDLVSFGADSRSGGEGDNADITN